MAKKKDDNNTLTGYIKPYNWVQKADPLALMRTVPFTLGELKILDTYISRINAADDTHCTVIFTKEEYEELMGIPCANYRALQKHTKGMLGKVVELEMPNREYLQFVLFTYAHYHPDDYGTPVIELTCSEQAKELFFCIGKYHYFKYALENIIKLTRKASYLLYVYIVRNRFRSNWNIDLDELRDTVLDCKGQESYKEFKIFKNRILDPAVKEISEKTDCKCRYDVIKRGRRVVAISFEYTGLKELGFEGEDKGQTSFLDLTDNTAENPGALAQAVDNSFDEVTMRLIGQIIKNKGIPDEEAPMFLREMWLMLNVADKRNKDKGKKSISDKAMYLIAMLKKYELPANDDGGESSFSIDKWYELAESYDPESIDFKEDDD
jgi:plasmid replication initiation protein